MAEYSSVLIMNSACAIRDPARDYLTILVVEDDILARMALTDELRRHGFNVAEAKNADEALSVVHSGIAVHVVIIDFNAPGLYGDGVRLAAIIRAEYPTVKVFAASEQARHAELQENVDAVFEKPYDVPRLVVAIKSLLD